MADRSQQARIDVALAGVPTGSLAEADRRSRLHPAELRALRRRRVVPGSGHAAHGEDLESAPVALRRGAPQGRARRLADSELDHRACARLHRPRQRDHRGPPDRRAAEARDHAERRLSHGRERAEDLRLRARSARRGGLHQVPEDPQRGRLRRLHRRHPALPQLAHPHGPARRVRPRPDHRRLPPRRALRREPADRAQAAGEGRPRRRDVDGRDHSRSRRARRADPGARRAARDGGELRVRHLRSGAQRGGGRPMALLRLSGRGQGAERRRDVARADFDLPRHLLRTRPGARGPQRGAGAGDHRRLRDQAAHRALPAHARIRRALRGRSHLGHRVDRWHGRRRPVARDEDELPHAPDALQPRARARAESHHLVLTAPARSVPALRGPGRDRHERDPVRERRDHAPQLGRRWRDRVLCLADAPGQADAVLRRAREPGQVSALCDQRRPRRDQRRADRAGLRARVGRRARLRRRARAGSSA